MTDVSEPLTTQIHPTAVVDAAAELGTGVVVGPHAVVGPRVDVGDRTRIDASAVIQGPTRLGADNRVFSGACVGFDPQDLKYGGEETFLEVGDRNHFREHCTIHRGTGFGGGVTKVGDDNLFMVFSHVAHDCLVGSRALFVNNATLGGHVEVGDDAVVGAFTSVHQFCRVGRHAYIGGYSVITRDVLPFVKVVGAKPVCLGVNRIGLERKGYDAEQLKTLGRAYRILVRSGQATGAALEQLRTELGGDASVDHLVDFVEGSQRGVITDLPGRKKNTRGG
ncbi:MAG: acyl-ACP--UDP-N-acetylglucosamine O-acyltransferase [Acidobacteriota bacterium]